jgi:hypothetical protein
VAAQYDDDSTSLLADRGTLSHFLAVVDVLRLACDQRRNLDKVELLPWGSAAAPCVQCLLGMHGSTRSLGSARSRSPCYHAVFSTPHHHLAPAAGPTPPAAPAAPAAPAGPLLLRLPALPRPSVPCSTAYPSSPSPA